VNCVECGRRICSARDVLVWVRIQNTDGESLTTGRVPMHLLCSLDVAEFVVASGGRAEPG